MKILIAAVVSGCLVAGFSAGGLVFNDSAEVNRLRARVEAAEKDASWQKTLAREATNTMAQDQAEDWECSMLRALDGRVCY